MSEVVSLGMGKFSGARIPQAEVFTMRRRWALPCCSGHSRAHVFTSTDDALVSLCGVRVERIACDSEGVVVWEEGNWGRCKRCAQLSAPRPRRGRGSY